MRSGRIIDRPGQAVVHDRGGRKPGERRRGGDGEGQSDAEMRHSRFGLKSHGRRRVRNGVDPGCGQQVGDAQVDGHSFVNESPHDRDHSAFADRQCDAEQTANADQEGRWLPVTMR